MNLVFVMETTGLTLELNLENDILTLYTPYTGPMQRIQHTRSALLQKRGGQGEATLFNILSSVTFSLVVSLQSTLSIDAFLKFLITAYCAEAYSAYSQNNEIKRHAHLYNSNSLSSQARMVLRRIDQQNRDNYEYCVRQKIFIDSPEKEWRWFHAGKENIVNETYRHMRNINFIRDIESLNIHNESPLFKGEKQYRITLDNHVILYNLLERLKYGKISIGQLKYSVRLLDPIGTSRSRYELFQGTNFTAYIKKQLDASVNHRFPKSLYFEKHYLRKGGLLQSALFTETSSVRMNNITNLLNQSVSIKEIEEEHIWKQALDDSQTMTVKKQVVKEKPGFTLHYNSFYIDLSHNEHTHVEYFDRLKAVMSHDATQEKEKKKKSPVIKEAKCKDKNQPLLANFVKDIPNEAKRKYDVSLLSPLALTLTPERATKIQRTEKGQATILQFFK